MASMPVDARQSPGDRSAAPPSLAAIHVYPVKSARGIELTAAEVGPTGFRHDRQWMVVDGDGNFITQRSDPRMCFMHTAIDGESLTLRVAGLEDVRVPLVPGAGEVREVTVWNDRVRGLIAGAEVSAWLAEFLGAPHHLAFIAEPEVRQVDLSYGRPGDRVGFADGYPFLLISEASLEELNRRLASRGQEPLPMNRFRPNLVVRDTLPFEEDDWADIGICDVSFRVAKPCARCVVTTTNQETGQVGKEPLKTLATFRRVNGKVMFGQNLIHDGRGRLQVGAGVTVKRRRA